MIDWYGAWLRFCAWCGAVAIVLLFADCAYAEPPAKIWTAEQMGRWVVRTVEGDTRPVRARDCVDERGVAERDCLRRFYHGVELITPRFGVGRQGCETKISGFGTGCSSNRVSSIRGGFPARSAEGGPGM